MRKIYLSVIIITGVLLFDQLLKLWVKTHMMLGEEFSVLGNWFYIHFTENNGMAFGLEFAGVSGKIILTVFRIIAVIAIGWYIHKISKKKVHTGLIVAVSLVWAGAFGNIIDSMFYGILFNDSFLQVAQAFPEGGGYAPFLQGQVVDMLYFPLFEGHYPEWFPFWKGESFIFFRPVFNIADSAITVGVLSLLVFQRKFFPPKEKEGSQQINNSTVS